MGAGDGDPLVTMCIMMVPKRCYDDRMRTTVTLDSDVVEMLKAYARRSDRSFKAAVNDAIRAGLAAERGEPRPYRVPTRDMRLRPGIDLRHALQLADALEDEEILRKMELRK